jgi:hypothetical protein
MVAIAATAVFAIIMTWVFAPVLPAVLLTLAIAGAAAGLIYAVNSCATRTIPSSATQVTEERRPPVIVQRDPAPVVIDRDPPVVFVERDPTIVIADPTPIFYPPRRRHVALLPPPLLPIPFPVAPRFPLIAPPLVSRPIRHIAMPSPIRMPMPIHSHHVPFGGARVAARITPMHAMPTFGAHVPVGVRGSMHRFRQ